MTTRMSLQPWSWQISFTVVAIFPYVCLWRRSLCSNLVLTLKNCIEPPSYASAAYVAAIWPSFLFDSFVKIGTVAKIFWANGLPPPPPAPGKKFPVRLCVYSFQFKKKVLELNATMDQSSDRTVKHLCLWLQNEHGQQFCEEFASLPGGGGNYYRALKEGVTRIFRAVYLYTDSIFLR